MGSTRWCPTPEQLMILEEMYRNGVKTPNASQIQHITNHLSYYGKIEGKNVFYWFQNHKARERQKLRRKLAKQLLLQQHQQVKNFHHPHQIFHCFQSPPPPLNNGGGASSLSFYIPPQECLTEDASSKMMNYTWKLGIQESSEMEKKPFMGMNGRDWMMLVDDHHHVMQPCCSRPPLKTLELFPITSTNLKEESKQN